MGLIIIKDLRDVPKELVIGFKKFDCTNEGVKICVADSLTSFNKYFPILMDSINNDSEKSLNGINTLNQNIKAVGFDVETRPSTNSTQYSKNCACLIQISSSSIVLIIRINMFEVPKKFINFLQNTSILKVGIGIERDAIDCQTIFPGFIKNNSFYDILSSLQKYFQM